jgi:hypothetical protein
MLHRAAPATAASASSERDELDAAEGFARLSRAARAVLSADSRAGKALARALGCATYRFVRKLVSLSQQLAPSRKETEVRHYLARGYDLLLDDEALAARAADDLMRLYKRLHQHDRRRSVQRGRPSNLDRSCMVLRYNKAPQGAPYMHEAVLQGVKTVAWFVRSARTAIAAADAAVTAAGSASSPSSGTAGTADAPGDGVAGDSGDEGEAGIASSPLPADDGQAEVASGAAGDDGNAGEEPHMAAGNDSAAVEATGADHAAHPAAGQGSKAAGAAAADVPEAYADVDAGGPAAKSGPATLLGRKRARPAASVAASAPPPKRSRRGEGTHGSDSADEPAGLVVSASAGTAQAAGGKAAAQSTSIGGGASVREARRRSMPSTRIDSDAESVSFSDPHSGSDSDEASSHAVEEAGGDGAAASNLGSAASSSSAPAAEDARVRAHLRLAGAYLERAASSATAVPTATITSYLASVREAVAVPAAPGPAPPDGTLATLGYQVVRGAVKPSPAFKQRVAAEAAAATPIFNNNGEGSTEVNDNRRRQAHVAVGESDLVGLPALLEAHAAGLKPNTWVVLASDAGCAAQAPHSDWPWSAAFKAAATKPCGLIVALQDATTLDVWPGALQSEPARWPAAAIPRCRVQLQAGDALLFRGDLVHAGSAYSVANVRLHCYLDASDVPRPDDRTWWVQSSLRSRILT